MEINSGIRSVLTISFFYSLFQKIVFPRTKLTKEIIKPYSNQNILEIGCGTGIQFSYFPHTHYFGIDASHSYIQSAKKIYGNKATFLQIDINNFKLDKQNYFDLALVIGVLHHITDQEILTLFKIAKESLKPDGKLIVVEPCLVEGQSRIAKWIISKDRGRNVKDQAGYLALANQVFTDIRASIRHDLLRIPYTMIVLEAKTGFYR